MGQFAESVYTDPMQIRHLEALVEELPTNGHVVLVLNDGSSYDGVVCERPNVQVFRDSQAKEGINGVVRLERPDVPYWNCYVWLGDIHRVEHLDSTLGSET
ncbi:DUF3247 family protein [Dyella sedimenti]|uniref:DUF3247 family protein n=1 Tax=Dyella sedimenti TaxID=2919947 RepID=UPI001FA9C9EE|nr:DUF3247 family protein [Dyella sedimenti]